VISKAGVEGSWRRNRNIKKKKKVQEVVLSKVVVLAEWCATRIFLPKGMHVIFDYVRSHI